MTQVAEPQNLDAEQSVLGAILLADTALRGVLEAGVRPEHFHRGTHQVIFGAMLELHDAGHGIDLITLKEHLRSSGRLPDLGRNDNEAIAAIELLAGSVPAVGNWPEYAQIVVSKAHDREMRQAAQLLIDSIDTNDQPLRREAMSRLATPRTERVASTSTAAQLASRAFDRYEQTADQVELFPLPALGGHVAGGRDRLNAMLAGGPRRGEYLGVGGHASHGKSVFCDQWLELQVARGHEARLYLTEMTEDERVDRIVSRMSGVPLETIRSRRWRPRDRDAALTALALLEPMPFSITSAHDWTAEEIRLHIDFSGIDAIAVDTLHDIARPSTLGEEPGLRHISAQLRAAAKSKGRERALLVVLHLNDLRTTDYPPLPVNRDIRGSGMLIRHLDTCLMVWQQPDDAGEPAGTGVIRVTKARQGEIGQVPAYFNGRQVRWIPLHGEETS